MLLKGQAPNGHQVVLAVGEDQTVIQTKAVLATIGGAVGYNGDTLLRRYDDAISGSDGSAVGLDSPRHSVLGAVHGVHARPRVHQVERTADLAQLEETAMDLEWQVKKSLTRTFAKEKEAKEKEAKENA